MVFHHFDHQPGQGAAAGGDLMHERAATGFVLESPLDRLDLTADAPRAGEKFLFFLGRVTYADNIGGYPI